LRAVEVVVMTRAPRLVAHWVRIRPTPVLDRIYRLDQQVRCHAFQDRGRGDIRGDCVWHERNDIGCRNAVFGVGSARVGGGNSVAYPQRRHPVVPCLDRVADLRAEHEPSLGFDQHLARPGPGPRRVDVLQDFGSTGCGDFDGMHGNDSNLTVNTLSMKRGTTTDA